MDWRNQPIDTLLSDASRGDAPVYAVRSGISLVQALARLLEAPPGAALSVESDAGAVVGFVRESDLLEAAMPAGAITTWEPEPIGQALEFLSSRRRPFELDDKDEYGRLQYGYTQAETRLVISLWTEAYSSTVPPAWLGWTAEGARELVDVPALSPARDAEELKQQMRQRMVAHPLTGLLPTTALALDGALGYLPPREVARTAIRMLCPEGLARAMAAWLSEPRVLEVRESFTDLRHHARVGLMLGLGLTDLLGIELPNGLRWNCFTGVAPPPTPTEQATQIFDAKSFQRAWKTYLIDLSMLLATSLGTVSSIWDSGFAEIVAKAERRAAPWSLEQASETSALRQQANQMLGQPLGPITPWLIRALEGKLPRLSPDEEGAQHMHDGPGLWTQAMMIIATAAA